MAPRRILVVGNYPADQQQSMNRFAQLLVSFYQPLAEVDWIKPPALIAALPGLPPVVRKYLAYIDKLLLFPTWLALRARSYQLVHIADHSNSFYSFFIPRNLCIVTCHDLLAVRGAFGDPVVACEASPIGIWLQRLIMAGLKNTGAIAFDSQATFNDYLLLSGSSQAQRHAVIPIPLNAPFTANPDTLELSENERQLIPSEPYLLMVGSALPRKNRILALRVLLELGVTSPYKLVLAGAPPSPDEQTFINQHQLAGMVRLVFRPSHALLNHLYCRAHSLLFPSLAEGFGWPLLEAQASDCPVIASNTTSIPEVAGPAALYSDPHDVATFAHHVRSLEAPALRNWLISQGHENLRRFDHELIKRAYINFSIQVS